MSTPRSPNTISAKAFLAQKLLMRAIKSTKLSDIDAALQRWEPLASLISKEHPDYEPVLASYAVALLLRWDDRHEMEDIRKAIIALERALASLPNIPSKNRYQNLSNLGAAYMDRYETFRSDPKDLLRAAECWEQAYSISVPLGQVRESANMILPNLSEAYFYAYEVQAAGLEAVERAIKYFKVVLEHGPQDRRWSTRYKIGQCYSALYSKLKIPADLDAAIDHLTGSLEGELERDERQGSLMELSKVLSKKYDMTRDKVLLDAAIHWSRIAVQENQGEPSILRNLANLRYWTYKDLKDPTALDEAIDIYEVIWALYQSKPGRSMATFYYSFGTALMRRYDGMEARRQGNLQDIERAVDLMQLAVSNASRDVLEEYQHRLKGAIARRDKALGNATSSPPGTMRSSNTVNFPSTPISPTSISFADQTFEFPPKSGVPKRAPIPSLSSHAEPPPATPVATSNHRMSRSSERPAPSRASQVPSEAPSEATIIPIRRGQTAPSLLSESMSFMTVPAVQDLPSMDAPHRPRVLRRQTRSIPTVPLAKTPPATKLSPIPEKSRINFLSFAKLRGSKAV